MQPVKHELSFISPIMLECTIAGFKIASQEQSDYGNGSRTTLSLCKVGMNLRK